MRHVFIINPAAGKHRTACGRVPEIRAVFENNRHLGEPEFLYTEYQGHATQLAAACAGAGEPVRLYACGGDGTLSEVLQGMYPFETAQLACLPCGSANDYTRSFPGHDFQSIPALVTGDAHPVDVIRCKDGTTGEEKLSLDIACIGMDAEVGWKMKRYKHLPLVSGPMAYNLAIADVFCHPIDKDLTVTLHTTHGDITRQGRYFFALAASGQYYGGGYRGAPMARPDDGLLDFVLVSAMSRIRVFSFLSRYKKGEFTDSPLCEHFAGTSMTVDCKEGAAVSLDGECITAKSVTFTLCERPVPFVLPRRGTVKQPVFPKAKRAANRAAAGGAACASPIDPAHL